MPGVLIEVASVIGEAGAWSLVDRFGGREIQVPAPDRVQCGHPLAMALGLDAAKRFAQRFEGPRFLVPNGRYGVNRAADNAELRRLLENGASASTAAERCGCHIRTVWRVKARMRRAAAGAQPAGASGLHKSP